MNYFRLITLFLALLSFIPLMQGMEAPLPPKKEAPQQESLKEWLLGKKVNSFKNASNYLEVLPLDLHTELVRFVETATVSSYLQASSKLNATAVIDSLFQFRNSNLKKLGIAVRVNSPYLWYLAIKELLKNSGKKIRENPLDFFSNPYSLALIFACGLTTIGYNCLRMEKLDLLVAKERARFSESLLTKEQIDFIIQKVNKTLAKSDRPVRIGVFITTLVGLELYFFMLPELYQSIRSDIRDLLS